MNHVRNHEITDYQALLGEDGRIVEPGFARQPFWRYNRENINAKRMQVKEWDYFLINDDTKGVAFTISDLGYMQMASVSVLDFVNHREHTRTVLAPPSLNFWMPVQSEEAVIQFKQGPLYLTYEYTGGRRRIFCHFKDFTKGADLRAELELDGAPEESMNIAIPYADNVHFYYNQKINCFKASGKVVCNWHVMKFNPEDARGCMDWGRGVWPYHTHWYWATASGVVDGHEFGFNLGYGFGDISAASENMVWYDGIMYKLDDVEFTIPRNPMRPWMVHSSDGLLKGVFSPDLDRYADINAGVVRSNQHQYFGLFDGTFEPAPGEVVHIHKLRCAIENIDNHY